MVFVPCFTSTDRNQCDRSTRRQNKLPEIISGSIRHSSVMDFHGDSHTRSQYRIRLVSNIGINHSMTGLTVLAVFSNTQSDKGLRRTLHVFFSLELIQLTESTRAEYLSKSGHFEGAGEGEKSIGVSAGELRRLRPSFRKCSEFSPQRTGETQRKRIDGNHLCVPLVLCGDQKTSRENIFSVNRGGEERIIAVPSFPCRSRRHTTGSPVQRTGTIYSV